jgi:hypothetical protein
MGVAAREYYVTHYERAALLDRVERHLRDAAGLSAAPERMPTPQPAGARQPHVPAQPAAEADVPGSGEPVEAKAGPGLAAGDVTGTERT